MKSEKQSEIVKSKAKLCSWFAFLWYQMNVEPAHVLHKISDGIFFGAGVNEKLMLWKVSKF